MLEYQVPVQVPEYLYKVVTVEIWEESQSKPNLVLLPNDKDFIHFSEIDQVSRIIDKFFPNEPKVIVLRIDPKKLTGNLVKERNPGGVTEYYHLYQGSIPMDAVVDNIGIKKGTP